MAKTFNDFIIECEAYPHSQESLDLMKECAELSLMEKYIGDQLYMQEHPQFFKEGVELTNGYFSESVDESTLSVLCESADTKAKSLKAKLWKGIQKILRVFQNFFMRISNRFDETTSGAQSCLSKLNKLSGDEETVSEIKKIVGNAREKAGAFSPHNNQPYTKHVKFAVQGDVKEAADLRNWLAAGLSDKTVVADASVGNEKTAGALPVEVIKDVAAGFVLDGKGNLSGCLSNLTSSIADVKANGMVIRVNTKHIKKCADELQEIQQKIAAKIDTLAAVATTGIGMVNSMANMAAAKTDPAAKKDEVPEDASKVQKLAASAKNAAKNVAGKVTGDTDGSPAHQAARTAADITAGGDAEVAKITNELYSMLNSTIGASMKVYMGLNAYRAALVTGLSSYLKTKEKKS